MAETTNQELLSAWRSALLSVTSGQSYTMPGGRSLTRVNVAEIRDTIDWLQKEIARDEAVEAGDTGTGIAFARFN